MFSQAFVCPNRGGGVRWHQMHHGIGHMVTGGGVPPVTPPSLPPHHTPSLPTRYTSFSPGHTSLPPPQSHLPPGHTCPPGHTSLPQEGKVIDPPPHIWELWSMYGRDASHWNASLLAELSLLFKWKEHGTWKSHEISPQTTCTSFTGRF